MVAGEVETRIVKLEKQNRSLRLIVGILILGAVIFACVGRGKKSSAEDARHRIVYANKFVLTDSSSGTTRAALAGQTAPGGSAWLRFYDGNGMPQVSIELDGDDNPQIALMSGEKIIFQAP